MEPRTNFRLLFFSLCLVISLGSARSRLAPSLSPVPQPVSSPSLSPSPSPSPSEALDFSEETIELIPISPSEAESGLESESKSEPTETDTSSQSKKGLDTEPTETDSSSQSKEGHDTEPTETDFSSQIKKGRDIFASDLHAVPINPELKKICDQTDYSTLCMATVLPLVKDNPNVNSVLQVAVEAGSALAKEALSEAKTLASKPGTPEDVLSTLKDCEDGYDTAVENFQRSLDAFTSNDLGTMRSMLSAVITYAGDCEDQFTEMQIESPLNEFSEKLTEMASNCLAISSIEN